MARALELAARGLWTTDPNPRVGCVIVRDGRIVGEGWHEVCGGPHAEVMALAAAGAAARGATACVTLEPCSHHGRTPPCADALIAAGIGRVCVAARDPNPRVAGSGLARLAAAGIEVRTGPGARAARRLNPGFFSRHERGRPWLRLKLATSLDGRTALADGRSRWITGAAARADNQRLRARAGAILTGVATVLADDPRLDVRVPGAARQPLRVVLDSSLRLSPVSRIVAPPGEVLVLTSSADAGRRAALASAGVRVERLPAGHGGVDLAAALRRLAELEINELHVEAGATLSGALLAEGLVDELVLYMAPSLLGAGARPLAVLPEPATLEQRLGFTIRQTRRVGSDLRLILRPAAGRN
ncbi:MAG: bifunctional diaminohydroxyphosphoribosylaminopyrimidine deaminase/5-amino-6-(5-phosphoribosylamino)uracil reductase RibD [Gammaproteobacteria bacterium]|nr:bifunctional diaminohydroxyphosphoribosylaminopyrimidine deaminase/5-amino-6-(5-phosphoribosylamino)uracil reductase RibD [Gammaproteobacteria bacterium]